MGRLSTLVRRLLGRPAAPIASKARGDGCGIAGRNDFVFPERITLGHHVHIEGGGYFNGQGGLTIGDHVIFAPGVAVMTSMHRYKGATMVPYDEVDLLRPVTIERFVWVGMRAMILPGVTLREGTIVGAGAVVTKSHPRGAILGGNPAVQIGTRDMAAFQAMVDEGRHYLKLKQEQGLRKREVLDAR